VGKVKLLDRYVGKTVIVSILMVLLVLLILVAFGGLMEELGDVGEGEYTTADAFLYVLLIIPRRTYEIFPVAVLLGSMIGLGGLASNSELTAMRAAGVSLGRIVLSALRAGVVMMAVVIIVGELIAPNTEHYAETMRATRLSKQITLQSEYGFWARDGGSFVNIRQILPGARLKDIYIYEFTKEGKLRVATHAGFAQYRDNRWLLSNIHQSEFSDQGVTSKQMDSASWDSMLNPALLNVVVVRPTMLPAWGLYRYIRFMHENGQSAIPFEVAFWSKMVMPVVTLVMVFLSVPFVFGMLRTVGIGPRIFVGTLIGTGFFLLNKMFSHLAVVYELNPLFAASFPAFAMLALGFWVLRRVH
jgi:lipopolysaccharide export system permease protein